MTAPAAARKPDRRRAALASPAGRLAALVHVSAPAARVASLVALSALAGGALAPLAQAEEEGRSADAVPATKPGPTLAFASTTVRGRLKAPSPPVAGSGAPRPVPGPSSRRAGLVLARRGIASKGRFEPSDSTGAAGPGAYLEFTNERVAVVRKRDGRILRTRELGAFLGSPGGDVADPQVEWDDQAGRWLYAALRSRGEVNYLEYGWTRTADPGDLRRGWCRFTVRTGRASPDFPKLGHGDRYLVVGANLFVAEQYRGSALYVVGKPRPGSRVCRGGRVSVFGTPRRPLTTTSGAAALTPVPANTVKRGAKAYVVAADDPLLSRSGSARRLMVWHVQARRGEPVLVEDGPVAVARYRIPGDVPQRSSAAKIDASTFAGGLTQAVAAVDPAAGGRLVLWTQHTVRYGSRSQVRWYEVAPGRRRPVQHGAIRVPGGWAFNAAISPAADGSAAAIVYNAGGRRMLPDLRVRRRDAVTPRGEMGDEEVVARSRAAREPCEKRCPWGDYSAATPDPADPTLVWGSGQVDGRRRPGDPGAPLWETWNLAVSTGAPAAVVGLGVGAS